MVCTYISELSFLSVLVLVLQPSAFHHLSFLQQQVADFTEKLQKPTNQSDTVRGTTVNRKDGLLQQKKYTSAT